MLHGANPDEAVSVRGPIAIRYRSPLRFSNENDFYRAVISAIHKIFSKLYFNQLLSRFRGLL